MVVTALHVFNGILVSFLIKEKYSKIFIILGTYVPDLDILFIDILEPNIKAHRTFTHSFYSIFLPIILGIILKKKYLIALGLGIFLHVLLDFVTGGIYLFYPFYEILIVGYNFQHEFVTYYIADFIFIYIDTIFLSFLSLFYKVIKIEKNLAVLFSYLLFVYISFFIYSNILSISFLLIPFIIYFYRKGIYKITLK